ncbi:nuclear transport factor 2 family protein [Streptomyces sp. NPDC048603]|uniref:nuclear transport factor 2 family protein n=1 Tax=Streptomyces sp. NPDC048603 TaxID=3365577 RepID=UPI003722F55C
MPSTTGRPHPTRTPAHDRAQDDVREGELAALRAQVRSLSDRVELRELFDRYVISLDHADHGGHADQGGQTGETGQAGRAEGDGADEARFAELFTEDAEFSYPIGTATGITGYSAFQRQARGRWARTHHLSATHDIRVTGDLATLRVHQITTHVHQDEARAGDPTEPFDVGGYYDAGAVRTAAGWRLNRISFHVVWATGRRLVTFSGLRW